MLGWADTAEAETRRAERTVKANIGGMGKEEDEQGKIRPRIK